MERESFENEQVALLLNEYFVAIKVDREERPDIDHIYMSVCQAMTGQGGWPLTIVMTPEKHPFFAGTYFPKTSRHGLIGFTELLTRLAELWRDDRARLLGIGAQIVASLGRDSTRNAQNTMDTAGTMRAEQGDSPDGNGSERESTAPALLTDTDRELRRLIFHHAFDEFRRTFDASFGGFGRAPKFPSPHNLLFLLRHHVLTGEQDALTMVTRTLERMYAGGIWDHVGFGFARYSTDERWLVPHFEKMLYDNALLAHAYLDTYAVTGDPFFATVARQIFTYVLRTMSSPDGAFYSAEDADSEGVEGRFYVFTTEQIEHVLDPQLAVEFNRHFDISESGNFEGASIPNLLKTPQEAWLARHEASYQIWQKEFESQSRQANRNDSESGDVERRRNGSESEEFQRDWKGSRSEDVQGSQNSVATRMTGRLIEAREKVFAAREQRIHPHKDDKVLTAWNALMIGALAKGARMLDDAAFMDAAKRAYAFVRRNLMRSDGRLLARYREREAKHLAYLDDYAFLAWAVLELYETTFDISYLETALFLVKEMERLFGDGDNGGFYFYGSDAEQLLTRPRELYDGAMPSGNSVAAYVLAKLAAMTGDQKCAYWRDRLMEAFVSEVDAHPTAFSQFLIALQLVLYPTQEVVLAGRDYRDSRLQEMVAATRMRFYPQTTVMLRTDALKERMTTLAPFTESQEPIQGVSAAYVCESFACRAPVTEPTVLALQLDSAYQELRRRK